MTPTKHGKWLDPTTFRGAIAAAVIGALVGGVALTIGTVLLARL